MIHSSPYIEFSPLPLSVLFFLFLFLSILSVCRVGQLYATTRFRQSRIFLQIGVFMSTNLTATRQWLSWVCVAEERTSNAVLLQAGDSHVHVFVDVFTLPWFLSAILWHATHRHKLAWMFLSLPYVSFVSGQLFSFIITQIVLFLSQTPQFLRFTICSAVIILCCSREYQVLMF